MKDIFIIVMLAGISCQQDLKPIRTGLENKPMPFFNLMLLDSLTHFNTKMIPIGNPSVLFFYSPFCPYCKVQMSNILGNISKLKNIRFYFVTFFPISTIRRFYDQYKLDKYDNIIPVIDFNNSIRNYFKISQVPYTAIYGRDKRLNAVFIGNVSYNQIMNTANDLDIASKQF